MADTHKTSEFDLKKVSDDVLAKAKTDGNERFEFVDLDAEARKADTQKFLAELTGNLKTAGERIRKGEAKQEELNTLRDILRRLQELKASYENAKKNAEKATKEKALALGVNFDDFFANMADTQEALGQHMLQVVRNSDTKLKGADDVETDKFQEKKKEKGLIYRGPNMKSLEKIAKENAGNLYAKVTAIDSHTTDSSKKEYITKTLGYTENGWFGNFSDKELKDVVAYLRHAAFLESKEQPKMEDVMKYLADTNDDGRAEAGKTNWYVNEAEMLDLFSRANKADAPKFTAFLKARGYDIDTVNKLDMPKAKKAFLQNLARDLMIAPLPVLLSGSADAYISAKKEENKALTEQYKTLLTEAQIKEMENMLLADKKIADILSRVPAWDKTRIWDAIRMEAAGVVAGEKLYGAGASFDISKATKNIIDSLSVGFVTDGHGNTIPGIAIRKGVHTKDGKYGAGVSLYNGIIPMVDASARVFDGFDKKSAPKEWQEPIKGRWALSLSASYGFNLKSGEGLGSAVLLSVDKQKATEINKQVADLKVAISGIFDKLKTADYKAPTTVPPDKSSDAYAMYLLETELYGVYTRFGKNPQYQEAITQAFCKNHENTQYALLAQNQPLLGYFRGISLGLAFIAGFQPIPVGGIAFEKFQVGYAASKEHQHNAAEAKNSRIETTNISLTPVDHQKGLALAIPKIVDGKAIHAISAPVDVQIETEKDRHLITYPGKTYHGKINIVTEYRTDDKTKLTTKVNILVIGEPKMDKHGRLIIDDIYQRGITKPFEQKDFQKVTSSVTPEKTEIISGGFDAIRTAEQKDLAAVKTITDVIEKSVNRETRDAHGEKLQKSIANLLNSLEWTSVEKVWDEFQAFAKKVPALKELDLSKALTGNQKRKVLETVFGRFMNDRNLKGKVGGKDSYDDARSLLQDELQRIFGKNTERSDWINMMSKENDKDKKEVLRFHIGRWDILNMPMSKFETEALASGIRSRHEAFVRTTEKKLLGGLNKTQLSSASQSLRDAQDRLMTQIDTSKPYYETATYNECNLIGFPVSSQIGKDKKVAFRDIAPITGAIKMVKGKDGKSVMVDITNPDIRAALVNALPKDFVQKLADRLAEMWGEPVNALQVRAWMKSGAEFENPTTKQKSKYIDFDAVMFKWGDCGNDAYGLKGIKLNGLKKTPEGKVVVESETLAIGNGSVSAVNEQTNTSRVLGLGMVGKREEKAQGATTIPGESSTGATGGTAGSTKKGFDINGPAAQKVLAEHQKAFRHTQAVVGAKALGLADAARAEVGSADTFSGGTQKKEVDTKKKTEPKK